ncbi:MAG TPA: hypothetical protein VMV66_02245 [Candidatus Humimicrobiaceae bacterium]|nr:hypothetical protein [Candidatus Humimicrobiaceae bacterium]
MANNHSKINQKGFIQIPVLIAIITGLLIVGGVGYFGIKQHQNNQNKNNNEEKQQELQGDVVMPEGPTEISGEGFYSITLETSPSIQRREATFRIKLKNLNVEPFITNLGTDSCNITDSKGQKYLAAFTSEIKLKKALLPGEEIAIDIARQRLGTSFIQEGEIACAKEGVYPNDLIDGNFKCIYNSSGECVCEDLGDLKINDCIFRITTDGKIASNNWGKYPLTVTIEK